MLGAPAIWPQWHPLCKGRRRRRDVQLNVPTPIMFCHAFMGPTHPRAWRHFASWQKLAAAERKDVLVEPTIFYILDYLHLTAGRDVTSPVSATRSCPPCCPSGAPSQNLSIFSYVPTQWKNSIPSDRSPKSKIELNREIFDQYLSSRPSQDWLSVQTGLNAKQSMGLLQNSNSIKKGFRGPPPYLSWATLVRGPILATSVLDNYSSNG